MILRAISILASIAYVASACSAPATQFQNDFITALAWGTIDSCHSSSLRQTQKEITPNEEKQIKIRKKRTLYLLSNPTISCEMRYVFAVAPVNEDLNTFITLEIPINFQIPVPFIEVVPAKRKKREIHSDFIFQGLGELLGAFGIDGGSCILRNLCEVSSLTPLKPQGIVGELMSIAARYLMVPKDETSDEEMGSRSFLNAASIGRAGLDCSQHFNQCPFSFLNFVQTSV